MPSTTNFGWTTPADTDLVKDGASAIRTLGNGIDTSFVDLKGGTTGQVLSKNSNTDLDFTWVAQDDSNAIQNAIVDAKGDLISATAADTPARLAVGADGTYLQADSTTSTGLKWGSVSAGGMTLISTTTMSGSTVTLSSIPATYKHLQILIKDIDPTDDADYCNMRLNSDSTSNRYKYVSVFSGGAAQTFNGTSVRILSDLSNATNDGFSIINIYDYANTTTYKSGQFYGFNNESATQTQVNMTGGYFIYNQTAAISSLQFISTFNTWAGGTIELYGVK